MRTQHDRDEPEYVVVPLEAQVAMSTFLYAQYQQNVVKRLDKYLTFPQWLMTLDSKPHQLEDLDVEVEVKCQPFFFVAFEWLPMSQWGFNAALTTGQEYSAFDLSLGIFSLIWMCSND